MIAPYQVINEANFEKISSVKTSRELWKILKNAHRGVDKVVKVRLQILRREFEELTMNELESVFNYFSRVSSIVNEMKRNGEEIDDVRMIE